MGVKGEVWGPLGAHLPRACGQNHGIYLAPPRCVSLSTKLCQEVELQRGKVEWEGRWAKSQEEVRPVAPVAPGFWLNSLSGRIWDEENPTNLFFLNMDLKKHRNPIKKGNILFTSLFPASF